MSEQYAIGIDIGGTGLKAALVSSEGSIIRQTKTEIGNDVKQIIRDAVSDLGRDLPLKGVVIGAPGIIDRSTDTVLAAANVNALEGISFRDLDLGIPVAIYNDADLAAIGERWKGAAQGLDDFVLLTLGTGIGSGIVLGGMPMGTRSEAGHMSVVANGDKCLCGNYGCLEMYASGRALSAAIQSALEQGAHSLLKECCKGNIYRITPQDIWQAALEGDVLARETLRNGGYYLGVGIANIIHMLGVEHIILTGGLIGAWDIYVREAMNEISRRILKQAFASVTIERGALHPSEAGVLGAAWRVFNG